MAIHQQTLELHQQVVSRVIAIMRSDLSAPLSLDTMAEIASMSRFHFLRVFESVTGVSPGRFHSALRMDRAKQLLLESVLPVTSVCYEVGYNSLGTFTRQFAELVGASPSSFRMRMRQLRDRSLSELISAYRVPSVSGKTISGEIETPLGFRGYVFIGLFSYPLPQGRPTNGIVLKNPRTYELSMFERKPQKFLLAAGFPDTEDLQLSDTGIGPLVGAAALPKGQYANRSCNVFLRPLTPFDPPILIALPLLLELVYPTEQQLGRSALAA